MANDTTVTRTIGVEDEIWTPTERGEKGPLLTLEEQRGVVEMELTVPLELSDAEPIESLKVRSPNMKQIQAFNGNAGSEAKREINFYGGCCVGIKPQDVENLHGRDWTRLTRLVTNFIL